MVIHEQAKPDQPCRPAPFHPGHHDRQKFRGRRFGFEAHILMIRKDKTHRPADVRHRLQKGFALLQSIEEVIVEGREEREEQAQFVGRLANGVIKASARMARELTEAEHPRATEMRTVTWELYDGWVGAYAELIIPPFDDPANPNRPEWLATQEA